jgi:hypothetical protein
VCPDGVLGICEQDLTTRLTRLDRLDRTTVVITHAATPGALTIQRP